MKQPKNPIAKEVQWRETTLKKSKRFYFRIMGYNGKNVHTSQRYTRKTTMLRVIKRWQQSWKYSIPVYQCNSKWQKL